MHGNFQLNRDATRPLTWAMLTIIVLLTACSATAPSMQLYRLSSGHSEIPQVIDCTNSGFSVQLATVELPAYLLRTHMMLASTDNQLTAAYHHRWAEPLSAGIRRVITARFAALHTTPDTPIDQKPDYRLDLTIEHFHGATSGNVLLEASWSVREAGQSHPVLQQHFRELQPQPAPGYPALVQTQQRLLDALADAVVYGLCRKSPQ